MHIVSEVTGTLREGLGYVDVLRAAFPAGTVSGAPKIRALEIIRELEPVKRNVYSGAVGYLGWHGDADMAIRSEEHTSELQSLMRISYAVFCLKKKNKHKH